MIYDTGVFFMGTVYCQPEQGLERRRYTLILRGFQAIFQALPPPSENGLNSRSPCDPGRAGASSDTRLQCPADSAAKLIELVSAGLLNDTIQRPG